MKKLLIATCCMGLLVSSSGIAFGQTLASDDFSYSGALTANGWTAHSGAGNKQIMANGSFATLVQSGGSGEDVNLSFAAQGAAAKTYASFDLTVLTADLSALDVNGLYLAHFKDGGFAFRGRTGVVVAGGLGDFGLAIHADSSTLGAGAKWASDLTFGTTYRVVISWNAVTGQSELWLDPTSEADTKITHTGANTGTLIEGFALRQSNDYTGNQQIDNVFVGTSFNAVPEPASMLVLGLGALALLRRRKRS